MTAKSGLVLVDKPSDFTSHDVVAKSRGALKTRKVGHAGTLDPMATGLLLLGVNNGTKLLTYLVGANKTYEATIRLGASTITDDRESEYLSVATEGDVEKITKDAILAQISALTGEILQVPSSVSAIKVNGERAYAKVRSGDEVKLAARPVTIFRFDLVSEPQLVGDSQGNQFVDIDVIVECSSGTYIRALARDLGQMLKTISGQPIGGHLTALRRTRVGEYRVEDAHALSSLGESDILGLNESARSQFTSIELNDQQVLAIRQGKRIASLSEPKNQPLAAFEPNGNLVAMLVRSGKELKSTTVFQVQEVQNV
jgi:tRNA pseudouridine55 synthase